MRYSVHEYIGILHEDLLLPYSRSKDIIDEIENHCRLEELSTGRRVNPTQIFGEPGILADSLNTAHIPLYRFFRSSYWVFVIVAVIAIVRIFSLATMPHVLSKTWLETVEILGPVFVALAIALGIAYQLSWDRSAKFRTLYSFLLLSQILVSSAFLFIQPFLTNSSLHVLLLASSVKTALYVFFVPLCVTLLRRYIKKLWDMKMA